MRRPGRATFATRSAFALACLACLAFAVLGVSRPASAQAPPPAVGANVYSAYEEEYIAEALATLGRKLDPNPEGKIVERIDVFPHDVFEDRDPLPEFLNVFHATTREKVVRREVFLRVGQPYSQVLVDETLRNLRQLPQLSLVLVLATVGAKPGEVGVVVITKDVWSLRANWNLAANSGGIEELRIQPEERNLFGLHQDLSGNFVLQPSTLTFGVGYRIPRVDSSRVVTVAAANVVVNRDSGDVEGSYGSLVAGQPIYSGLAEWAWDATTSWDDVITRRYVNAAPSPYVDPLTCTGNYLHCPSVPWQYHALEYVAKYELRRSFGWDIKHELTLAVGMTHDVYRTDFGPFADPVTVASFDKRVLPVSDTRVGPSIQYETYAKHYVRLLDFDTLALQEDYRTGHDVILRVSPFLQAYGSSRDVIGLTAAAQYTWAIKDGLFRASVYTYTAPEPHAISDASIQPTAHLVTPTIGGVGRFVLDGTMLYRWRNYLNVTSELGGNSRLRGYPTNEFVGWSYVAYNLEFRTRPIEILTCQVAGVGFFDAGDAFYTWSAFRPYQSVGFGIRALFPWLDRVVFRADLGFPLEHPIDTSTLAPIAPVAFAIAFGQAFDVPAIATPPVLPTEQYETPTSTGSK